MNISGSRVTALTALLAAVGFAANLAGCVSTGGIAPTAEPIKPAQAMVQQPAAPVEIGDTWWTAYGDSVLDDLVIRGLAANPSLAVVRTRIERAQAQVNAADAQRKPRVDGGLDIAHQRYSENGLYPPSIAGSTQDSGALLVSGSWEIDVFGRRRAALDAAVGTERAAEADFQAARVLLSSNIVRQYVQLARLGDQREVLQRSLAQRQEILALIRQRLDAGLDTAVELRQGEGALPEIRVALDSVDEQVELTRHALAVLTGQAPDALDGTVPRLAKVRVVPLPDNVPADLLGRRADVSAARWRVESATHDLQSARAEFYPSVNLLAFAGFSAIGLDNLLQAGSRQYGAGAALRLPIFDAGRLRANYKAKATDVDSAVEGYNAAVLEALREAADALSTVRHAQLQQQQQVEALASAEQAYDLAVQRYRGGLGTYLTVLTAETNVLTQRRIDNDLKAKAMDSQAQLARALGGGYVQDGVVTARAGTSRVTFESQSTKENLQ